jgi:hypothetical protein
MPCDSSEFSLYGLCKALSGSVSFSSLTAKPRSQVRQMFNFPGAVAKLLRLHSHAVEQG